MKLALNHKDLLPFIEFLGKDHALVAPVEDSGRYIFRSLEDTADITTEYKQTPLPPVKFIYPDKEPILKFDLSDDKHAESVIEAPSQALLLLRPCDINAISIMDEVLSEEPSDLNDIERRKNTLIVGFECATPCRENALCFDKGTHNAKSGFDIYLTEINGKYFAEVNGEKGEKVAEASGFFNRALSEDRVALDNRRIEREEKFEEVLSGNTDELSTLLEGAYDNELWEKSSKKCVSCGACNIVCPTCYCYDVTDEVDITTNHCTRTRHWDGCQLRNFTSVATGETFRKSKSARLRHRVLKKEVYLKERFGRSGCVGCGRCIDHCMAKISIIDIYNDVFEDKGQN